MTTMIGPALRVVVHGDTATLIDEDGSSHSFTGGAGTDVREAVVAHAARIAHDRGHMIALETSGDRGIHRIEVGIHGEIKAIEAAATDAAPPSLADDSRPADHTMEAEEAHEPPAARLPLRRADRLNEVELAPVGSPRLGQEAGQRSAPQRPSDPAPTRNEPADTVQGQADAERVTPPPATEPESVRVWFIDADAGSSLIPSFGPRSWLRRAGIARRPSSAEVARYERIRLVSAQWAGPRTIAVVNGKGGVGKTPTTAMLSAVYARYGGGSVLAFDNNDTRGTLGWRTEQARHETTITDLLAAAPRLQEAATSELAAYIHHQTDDRYDVLRSNPRVLSAEQRLTTAEFDTLLETVTRGYRLVVFDSGNDESAERWLRMIDWAGQLVVPTLASPESAESAALLLEALATRDDRSAALARDAVVVITEAEPAGEARRAHLVDTFSALARAVTVIPFDPGLKAGPLRFGALHAATREAWITTAAHAVERF